MTHIISFLLCDACNILLKLATGKSQNSGKEEKLLLPLFRLGFLLDNIRYLAGVRLMETLIDIVPDKQTDGL